MFLAASLMALVGLFVKFMPLSIYGIVEFRGLFGLFWITIILLALKRTKGIRKLANHGRLLLVLVTTNAFVIFFYFLAIDIAGLAIGAFLLYVGNLVALFFMRVVLTEK